MNIIRNVIIPNLQRKGEIVFQKQSKVLKKNKVRFSTFYYVRQKQIY